MEKPSFDQPKISLPSQRYYKSLKQSKIFSTNLKHNQNSKCAPMFNKKKIFFNNVQQDKRQQFNKKDMNKYSQVNSKAKEKLFKRKSVQQEQEESSQFIGSQKIQIKDFINNGISLDELKKSKSRKLHQLNITKKNTINLYSPNYSLPSLNRTKILQKEIFEKKKPDELNLVELGIFTSIKDTFNFLRKFRQTLQHQFIEPVDVDSEQDLHKLQFYLLNQIYHEGKWIQ